MADIQLINYLSGLLSERRLNTINKVLDNRTRYITVALEDIYQSQNASAVMRTCECMGIQDLHIIENKNQFNYNPEVAMGSGKWTTLHRYNKHQNNSINAINRLKTKGYSIVATVPGVNCLNLSEMNIADGKIAIVIGSELTGISNEIISNCDVKLTIPMYGFTESYNLSVSLAIILYEVVYKLKKSGINWQLSDQEKNELKLEWLKASLKRPELLIKDFESTRNHNI